MLSFDNCSNSILSRVKVDPSQCYWYMLRIKDRSPLLFNHPCIPIIDLLAEIKSSNHFKTVSKKEDHVTLISRGEKQKMNNQKVSGECSLQGSNLWPWRY